MKLTIEFSDDERDEARMALDAVKWHLVVWDMSQHLRGLMKNMDDDDHHALVEGINNSLWEFIESRGLTME